MTLVWVKKTTGRKELGYISTCGYFSDHGCISRMNYSIRDRVPFSHHETKEVDLYTFMTQSFFLKRNEDSVQSDKETVDSVCRLSKAGFI